MLSWLCRCWVSEVLMVIMFRVLNLFFLVWCCFKLLLVDYRLWLLLLLFRFGMVLLLGVLLVRLVGIFIGVVLVMLVLLSMGGVGVFLGLLVVLLFLILRKGFLLRVFFSMVVKFSDDICNRCMVCWSWGDRVWVCWWLVCMFRVGGIWFFFVRFMVCCVGVYGVWIDLR